MVSQFIDMESDHFHGRLPSNKIPETGFHQQTVKTVAYLRVSTAQQDAGSQRLAILEYARKHDFHIDDFIEATASGRASETRRRLDQLVVTELSRLGRSLGQIVAILDALAKEPVSFIAIKENIRVEGKQDIQTKVMTTLFAELERDLISERTREGLARARSTGKKLGRPAVADRWSPWRWLVQRPSARACNDDASADTLAFPRWSADTRWRQSPLPRVLRPHRQPQPTMKESERGSTSRRA